MTSELKALALYCLTIALIVTGSAWSARWVLDHLALPVQASEIQEPELAPRIAAWKEREAEDAHFTELRRVAAERELHEWQERHRRTVAALAAVPAPPARATKPVRSRSVEMSSRRRSHSASHTARVHHPQAITPSYVVPSYVGGLTAAHAEMRDRSGN